MKLVKIHSEKYISLKNYVQAWKILKSVPEKERDLVEVKESLCTWWPVSVKECLKQYTSGIHDRINLKASGKFDNLNWKYI